MEIKKMKLSALKPADYNPRTSTKQQEENLKASLEKFGVVEPVIFNKQTGHIVGGHFRVRELKKLGHKEVDCVIVDLNEEDEKELNIRLNANTGGFDFDRLANEWNEDDLNKWGLNVWKPDDTANLDQFFADSGKTDEENKFKIILNYTEDEHSQVKAALEKINASPEKAVWQLLNL